MSTPPPSGSSWGNPSSGGLPGGDQPSGGWGAQPGGGQPQPGGWGGGAGAGPGGTAATWGSRVGATLLDAVILVVPFGILFAIFGGIGASTIETTTDPTTGLTTVSGGGGVGAGLVILYLVFIVVSFGYYIYFPTKWNGQTPGKRVLGIRTVRLDGQAFTAGFAALREILVKSLLMGICFIVLILDWLWPLWDDKDQALHDKVINTRVVRA